MEVDQANMALEKKHRARKSNFSAEEVALLVDEGVQHHSHLSASFGPGVTKKSKDSIWEEIATKISANTAGVRSASEVRKKWNDIRCQVKKRAQLQKKEAGKTGGGPSAAAVLNELDEKVLSTIPTCQVEGIDGGSETPICTEPQPSTSSHSVLEIEDEACLPQESAAASTTTSSTGNVVQLKSNLPHTATSTAVCATTGSTSTPKSASRSQVGSLVKVEESKVEVLQQLLSVETQRLAVERERLGLERDRLALERHRLEMKERIYYSNVESVLRPIISLE